VKLHGERVETHRQPVHCSSWPTVHHHLDRGDTTVSRGGDLLFCVGSVSNAVVVVVAVVVHLLVLLVLVLLVVESIFFAACQTDDQVPPLHGNITACAPY